MRRDGEKRPGVNMFLLMCVCILERNKTGGEKTRGGGGGGGRKEWIVVVVAAVVAVVSLDDETHVSTFIHNAPDFTMIQGMLQWGWEIVPGDECPHMTLTFMVPKRNVSCRLSLLSV
jgi:hypothetical protein